MSEAQDTFPRAPAGLGLFAEGKIRRLYACPGNLLLMVASDRISAFDVVFDQIVPRKGEILTRISKFWFEQTAAIIRNHCLTGQEALMKDLLGAEECLRLAPRSMLVRRTQPLRIEAIVRRYLEGSAWAEYRSRQSAGGRALPGGLKRYDRLPEPIFTPSTKAQAGGKDIGISDEQAVGLIGREHFAAVREASLKLFESASGFARSRGLVLCDTKFEFGLDEEGALVLIDELLTPDSSRYWLSEDHAGGRIRPMDKQFLRNWLVEQGFNGDPPVPSLPPWLGCDLAARYSVLAERLMGLDRSRVRPDSADTEFVPSPG